MIGSGACPPSPAWHERRRDPPRGAGLFFVGDCDRCQVGQSRSAVDPRNGRGDLDRRLGPTHRKSRKLQHPTGPIGRGSGNRLALRFILPELRPGMVPAREHPLQLCQFDTGRDRHIASCPLDEEPALDHQTRCNIRVPVSPRQGADASEVGSEPAQTNVDAVLEIAFADGHPVAHRPPRRRRAISLTRARTASSPISMEKLPCPGRRLMRRRSCDLVVRPPDSERHTRETPKKWRLYHGSVRIETA